MHMARHLIDFGGGSASCRSTRGRIGGVASAKAVADYAAAKGVTYVNAHLHLAPGAVGVAAALCGGVRGEPHLRVSGGAKQLGGGHHDEPSGPG